MTPPLAPADQPRSRPRRAGYLYVGVMMTGLIVALVGVSALSVARVTLDASQRQTDFSSAQALARTAIEDAIRQLDDDTSWRSNLAHETEYPATPHSLGGGSFTWKLADPDGDLADDDADAVWLTGIGRAGEAVFLETVLLQPTGQPLSCLEAPFHCGTDVTLGSLVGINTNRAISSNGSITATAFLSSVQGDAEAAGAILGTVTGTKTAGMAARKMPSDTVFEYYLNNGTWIDRTSLPEGGSGTREIASTVLSPTINPFGSATNPEGIYVIDCQGQALTIMNCRVLGTLVLLNSTISTRIDWAVHVSSAVTNYPALLVDGDIEFRHLTSSLSEAVLGKNFNPVGAPYDGVEDSDTADTYPSLIKGLVYVSGCLKLPAFAPQSSTVDGAAICQSFAPLSNGTFKYRSTYLSYPPPGFAHGNPMQIVPGTWRRTALP